MRFLLNISLVLGLSTVFAVAGASSLVKISEEPKYDSGGSPTGVLIEYTAEKKDIEASFDWHPDKKPPLLSLDKVIERGKGYIGIIKGEYIYTAPEFCGADLRQIDYRTWYWEIHFRFELDGSIESQKLIRDGGGNLSVRVLPNGGQLHRSERQMTPKERRDWGVDESPNPIR